MGRVPSFIALCLVGALCVGCLMAPREEAQLRSAATVVTSIPALATDALEAHGSLGTRAVSLAAPRWRASSGAGTKLTTEAADPSERSGWPLRGSTTCRTEDADCNACVSHVADAFQRISRSPISKLDYHSRGGERLPPFDGELGSFGSSRAHVQGLARLPHRPGAARAGAGTWFALTRSTPRQPGAAGLFLVRLPDQPGDPLLDGDETSRVEPRTAGQTRFYYPIEHVDHPGGLQTLGRYAFVASDCADDQRCGRATFVDVFDLREPGSERAFLQRVPIGEQGEPGMVATITSVAVTRLATGKLLLFVLGKDSRHEGWFYTSDGPELTVRTHWSYQGYWARPHGARDEYQNISFVTECETGDLYLVGMGNAAYDTISVLIGGALGVAPGLDSMSLLRVAQGDDGELLMDVVRSRTFDPGGDGYCTFRAAAQVHVTPSHDLVLYCSPPKAETNLLGRPGRTLKLAVFAPERDSPLAPAPAVHARQRADVDLLR
jgi:hypothetical protein